jgi:hypothetical protein
MRRVAVAGGLSLAAGIGFAAIGWTQPQVPFQFDPVPRWAEDPETETVCEAVRKECAAMLKDGAIEADWDYVDVYDADGMLVGERSRKSTGCKPLDEHLLLSQRHFTGQFSKPGQPDLDAISAELAPGTPKSAVKLIKKGTTSVSMGC